MLDVIPYDPPRLASLEAIGLRWLQGVGVDYDTFTRASLHVQEPIYWALWTIATPEFVAISAQRITVWVIPSNPSANNGSQAGLALLLMAVEQTASGKSIRGFIWGDRAQAGDGGLYVQLPISMENATELVQLRFPPDLARLGIPSSHTVYIPPPPDRLISETRRDGPPSRNMGLTTRPPPHSAMPSRRHTEYPMDYGMGGAMPRDLELGMDRGRDRGRDRGIDRGMNRGMDEVARLPATHRGPARYQPTGKIVASSSSDSSESESDAPKKSTKKKATKGKSKGKAEGKSKKKSRGRTQSSSDSSEEDSPPRRKAKKTAKKDKPTGKARRRGRTPSDDEAAHSADDQRGKGTERTAGRRAKPVGDSQGPSKHQALEAPEQPAGRRNRGRTSSDDEGQAFRNKEKGGPSEARPRARDAGKGIPEKKAPTPMGGKAGKAPRGYPEEKHGGRSWLDDDGPPHVDPAEEARLKALKAENGYEEGKPEKSGWH
ncbi:MAG: hypothetical protein Q9168_004002 [Polycauliona sp. 1 TL-2023]